MRKIIMTALLSITCTIGLAQENLEQLSQRVQELEKTVKVLKDAYDKSESEKAILQGQYVIGQTIDKVEQTPFTFHLVKLEGNKNTGEVLAEVIITNKGTDKRVDFEYAYLLDSNKTKTRSKYPYFQGQDSHKMIIHSDTQVKLLLPFQLEDVSTQAIQGLELYNYSVSQVGSSQNELKNVMFRNMVITWK